MQLTESQRILLELCEFILGDAWDGLDSISHCRRLARLGRSVMIELQTAKEPMEEKIT
jgi:hypothetical protein